MKSSAERKRRASFAQAIVDALRSHGEQAPIDYDEERFWLILRGPPVRIRELRSYYYEWMRLTGSSASALIDRLGTQRYGSDFRTANPDLVTDSDIDHAQVSCCGRRGPDPLSVFTLWLHLVPLLRVRDLALGPRAGARRQASSLRLQQRELPCMRRRPAGRKCGQLGSAAADQRPSTACRAPVPTWLAEPRRVEGRVRCSAHSWRYCTQRPKVQDSRVPWSPGASSLISSVQLPLAVLPMRLPSVPSGA